MDTTVINNPEDLARLLGVKEALERDLSNAVYHYTECGAWLKLNEVRAAERRSADAIVQIEESQGRYIVEDVVIDYQLFKVYDLGDSALAAVIHFLGGAEAVKMDDHGRFYLLVNDPDSLDELANVNWERNGGRQDYEFSFLNARVDDKLVAYIEIGSTVEGVDATATTRALAFPFIAQAFWDIVHAVDEEAGYIYRQTHGCERCEADGWEGEWGLPAINPDCPKCHGAGRVI